MPSPPPPPSSATSYTTVTHGDNIIHYRSYTSETDLRHILALVSPSLSEPYSVYTYRYFLLKWESSCIFAFTSPTSTPPKCSSDEDLNYSCVGCCICKVDVTEGSVDVNDVERREDAEVDEGDDYTEKEDQPKSKSALAGALSKMKLHQKVTFPPPPPQIRTGYIGMLSTHPPLQGLGLAKEMLALSLRALVNVYKCDGVTLEVEEGNNAMHVYRAMGFVEVGRWKGYYLNGSGARRFKLTIDDKGRKGTS